MDMRRKLEWYEFFLLCVEAFKKSEKQCRKETIDAYRGVVDNIEKLVDDLIRCLHCPDPGRKYTRCTEDMLWCMENCVQEDGKPFIYPVCK